MLPGNDPLLNQFLEVEEERLKEASSEHRGLNADEFGRVVAGSVVSLFVVAVLAVVYFVCVAFE